MSISMSFLLVFFLKTTYKLFFKNFMVPSYLLSSTVSRLQSHYKKTIYPRSSWYSFHPPQKDERLSWPWIHPVVLNMGPLDWEYSALTTMPLLLCLLFLLFSVLNFILLFFTFCYSFKYLGNMNWEVLPLENMGKPCLPQNFWL